jgi:hypothetical protein
LLGICLFPILLAAAVMPILFDNEATEKKLSSKQQLEIKCKMSIVNAAGNRDVIAAPSVIVIAGQSATISISDEKDRTIEVELTGTIIQTNNEAEINLPAASNK